MIVLVSDDRMLNQYVKDVPGPAWDLIEAADRPLTIIYEGINPRITQKVLAEDGTCGIRLVKDEFCQGLITRFGKPIVSTSANFSGKASPGSFMEIDPEIIKRADHVVRFPDREKQNVKPSMVIRVKNNGEVKVIRS
jgi:L-threonylcarbamoyladenylate synthase